MLWLPPHGVIGPREEDPFSCRQMFSVNPNVNVSVASRFILLGGVLAPRSTLFLSRPDLGPAKVESGQIADCCKMQHRLCLGFNVRTCRNTIPSHQYVGIRTVIRAN